MASTPAASVKLASPEAELRRLVLELGLVRVEAAIADVKAKLTAWATSA